MHRLLLVLAGLAVAAAAGCHSKSNARDDGGGGGAGIAGAGGGAAGANGGSSGGGAGGSAGDGSGGSAQACAFASTYTIVNWSGPDTSDLMRLSPPATFYYHGETPYLDGDGGIFYTLCEPPLPACDDQSRVDVGDVDAAIAHPDVQAALAATDAHWYGSHELLVTNAFLLDFSRSDPRGSFRAGSGDCPNPSPSCVPTPPGVRALVDLLRTLRGQQCGGVR